MKKLLSLLFIILGLGLANAQQIAPNSASKIAPAKSQKMEVAKPATQVKTNSTNSALKLKKDGTPDKRYKANQKLKKDGTPDKRYKGNK